VAPLRSCRSCSLSRQPPPSPLFPYTTLFRSVGDVALRHLRQERLDLGVVEAQDGEAVEGHLVDELHEGLAEPSEAAVVVEVLRRSEEHTSELQSRFDLVCRLLLEKKKNKARH